jgi:hypothetical protein
MRLDTAIDVAAEYAAHLHFQDGVPREQAIAAGVAAVVRAARAHPGRIPARRPKDAGIGWSGPALAAVGSSLSTIGWLKTLFGGG